MIKFYCYGKNIKVRKKNMKKNYKPLIIGISCTLIVFMAIGFALLSQELTIIGTSSIDSNWNIRITNIRVKNLTSAYGAGTNASADVSGSTGCTTQTTPCDSTSANFEAKLITPGDSITYATSGLNVADTISHTSPNNTNTVDVTVAYNSETTTQSKYSKQYFLNNQLSTKFRTSITV